MDPALGASSAHDVNEKQNGILLDVGVKQCFNGYIAEPRFTNSARKHRVTQGSCLYVVDNNTPVPGTHPTTGAPTLEWKGTDEQGLEIEVVALATDPLVIIHAMPTWYRKPKKRRKS